MFRSASIIPYMEILAILLITIKLEPVDAEIGYDCDTKLENKVIPLEDIGYCDLATNGVRISTENIAVLQLNKCEEAAILQCKIKIDRVIDLCGSRSSNSHVINSNREYIYPISHKACEIALDHGTLTIGKTTINGLTMDGTTTHNVVLAGSIDSTGACAGAKYSDPYGTWDNVAVTGKVNITLKKRLVKVKLDSDIIELPSGHQCKFTNGECIDSDGGYTFRDGLPLRFCSEKMYSVLYNGSATKLQSEDERVYSVMVNKTRFSFTTIGNETSCGARLFKTESPKLFIAESEDLKHLEEFEIIGNHTNNSDIFQYKNDETIYVEEFTRYPMHYLYRNVMEHKCERRKAIMRIVIRTAYSHPDEFAFHYMAGPGYTAIMEEDRFYIVQCVPVEIKLDKVDKCYDLQPILKGNQKLFLTPWTNIITGNATELPCTSSLLQDHELESTTPKVMPKPVKTLEPTSPEPQSPEAKYPEPPSPQPQSPQPQSPQPQSPQPQSPQPQSPQPQSPEPQSPEPQSPEPQSPEPQSPEPQSPEPQSPEPQSPQPQSPEPESPEPQSPQLETLEPIRLKPKTKLTWNYKEPADLMNSGILNEEQVNRAWEYQRHPEQFNPPPSGVFIYPDANGNTPGVTYLNIGHKNHTS